MTLNQVFGASVRQYRKVKGMTQAQLAEASDLSVEMVGKIERGSASPSFDTIETLSNVLGVSAAMLFGAEPDQNLEGDRGQILEQIRQYLSTMNDADLEKAEGMLAAFVR